MRRAVDPAKRLYMAGRSTLTNEFELWAYDSSLVTWLQVQPPIEPPDRGQFSFAPGDDTGSPKLVMFGAATNCDPSNDPFWLLDDTGWSVVSVGGVPPSPRAQSAVAYDSARDRFVIFGGMADPGCLYNDPMSPFADTIELGDGTWSYPAPSPSPRPRAAHAMVFDEKAAVTVLFGGHPNGIDELGDTWLWNGTTWIDVTPATSPAGRHFASLAYDVARGKVVLFGGKAGTTIFGDTWEWDSSTRTWTQVLATSAVGTRYAAGMTYDSDRERIVLTGGFGAGSPLDVWEWDGATWTTRQPEQSAGIREAIVYDRLRHRIVTFGGRGTTLAQNDTWALAYRSLATPERCLLAGADEDGDGLAGCEDPDCWGRCSPLCPPATSCSPRCGDATCDPLEDRLICPQDCH